MLGLWEAACSSHSRLSSALEMESRKDGSVCWLLSCVQLFAALWTVACQAPLSMEFSRQEYWSGLPFPSPGGMTRGALSHLGNISPCPKDPTHCVSCSVMSDSLRLHGLSPPGSSVHGILQARILEWVAMPFSRGSSQPRDRTQVSCVVGGFFCCLSHQGSPSKAPKP